MKRFIFAVLAAVACVSNVAHAQKEWNTFNSIAAGVGVASIGIEANIATPLSKHFTLQAGLTVMPGFKNNADVDVKVAEYPAYFRQLTFELLPFSKSIYFCYCRSLFWRSFINIYPCTR